MNTTASKQTPAQGLHQLRQQSLRMLFNFAESTQAVARHNWVNPDKRSRAISLVGYIKRDLEEYKRRLDRIVNKTDSLSGKVLAHPHHPELLQLGGEYLSFIDDATAVITPLIGELTELLYDELDTSQTTATAI